MYGHSLEVQLERVLYKDYKFPSWYRPVIRDRWGTFALYEPLVATQKAAFEYAKEVREKLETFM